MKKSWLGAAGWFRGQGVTPRQKQTTYIRAAFLAPWCDHSSLDPIVHFAHPLLVLLVSAVVLVQVYQRQGLIVHVRKVTVDSKLQYPLDIQKRTFCRRNAFCHTGPYVCRLEMGQGDSTAPQCSH